MVFAQSASHRKRPMCHKCWSTMAGHTRKNNMFICPPTALNRSSENSPPLPSPPDSPPPTYECQGFQIPPGDCWHWRNPNWVSPPPSEKPQENALRDASLTPTEPLSDDQQERENISPFAMGGPANEWADHSDALTHYPNFPIKREESLESVYTGHSGSPSPRPWSPFSQSPITDISLNTALRAGTPLYSVYRVPRQDVPKVQRTAHREGKLFSVMNAPPAHLAKIPREKSRETVWVILSDREEDLRYAVHSQHMPGALVQGSSEGFDDPLENAVAPVMQDALIGNTVNHSGPQHVVRTATPGQSMDHMPGMLDGYGQVQSAGPGFFQMAFAGIIGGLIVTYGRALL